MDDTSPNAPHCFTYILKCSDDSYYTGWTNNLEKRIKTHNQGKGAKYTRARYPVELLTFWEFESKQEAMQWEWKLKQLSRSQKETEISKQKKAQLKENDK